MKKDIIDIMKELGAMKDRIEEIMIRYTISRAKEEIYGEVVDSYECLLEVKEDIERVNNKIREATNDQLIKDIEKEVEDIKRMKEDGIIIKEIMDDKIEEVCDMINGMNRSGDEVVDIEKDIDNLMKLDILKEMGGGKFSEILKKLGKIKAKDRKRIGELMNRIYSNAVSG